MRLNKQNKIIVGILAFLLTLTVGYAVFSQSMNITGTAKAEGNFSLIFTDSISIEKEAGSSGTTASREDNNKTLKINVPDLQYPSAYVVIKATIKNEGSIAALLKEIEITDKDGNAYNNSDIKITYSNVEINDIFDPNEEKDIKITVTWDKDSTNSKVDASFNISLKYVQATSFADSGSGGTSSESDWTFKVNDSGLITAYNYEKGTDVVVPAYVDGVAVTTINAASFSNANLITYRKNDAGDQMYMLINEEEPNFSAVKEKTLQLLTSDSCDAEDTECLEEIKQLIYFCKDESTCYSASDESIVISMPSGTTVALMLYINPDSSISLNESISTPEKNISTLDLSQATNLTTIGASAFSSSSLKSLNLGENSNLKTIGASAFDGNEISELIIPESVEEIGNSAFSSNNITSVTFKQNDNTLANNSNIKASYLSDSTNNNASKLVENSTGLKTIGDYVFYNNQISSIKLPDTITSIGSNAFSGNQIAELTIPNNVITIGEYAFYENQISSLLFEENSSLKTIEWSAFSGNQINKLTIPKTVISLGSSAFSNNPIETLNIGKCTTNICNKNNFGSQIKNLTIESGEIGASAFYFSSGTGTIESLILGDEVTSIGASAFYNNNISFLVLPNNIITIESSTFQNNQLTSITIPSSVTSIGSNAFSSNQISSLTIPSSVTSIEYQAFSGNQINKLTIPKTVISLGNDAFSNNPIETLKIAKCTASACSNNSFGTQVKTLTIESGEIGEKSFYSSYEAHIDTDQGGVYYTTSGTIESLILGNGVTKIGNSAFSSNQISELEIPNSVTSIGVNAFYLNKISTLEIPNSVTEIGRDAFYSNQISSLSFEENSSLTSLNGFSGNQLTSITISNSVTSIGEYAFKGNQITELTIPNSVTEIGRDAFYSNQISNLTFEENSKLQTIGEFTFYLNQISGELEIPNSVTTIGDFAFKGNQISSLEIPNSVTKIGDSAFYSNPLTSILIKRTEEDFLANVTVGSTWYSNSPTITYQEEE